MKKLAGTAPAPKLITDDQGVSDIMKQMMIKTQSCAGDYDKIYKDFEGGTIMDICERLYNFCLDNIETFTESEDEQFVSCPYTIMARGTSDCKGYALFVGGVLDAMRRHGAGIHWNYRFASYNLFDMEPHHVFVVVNKKTDDIWIDPIVGEFNYHYGYWHKRDRGPDMKKVGMIGFIGAVGDVVQPVPAGYPANLPLPTMTSDGKLVLRLRAGNFNPTVLELGWIKQALQPLITKYSKKPYNINWEMSGWGSGSGMIQAEVGNGFLHNRGVDFLQYPPMPTGLDKIEMGINDVLPAIAFVAVNALVPGLGGVVAKAIASETQGPGGNVSTSLPVGQQVQGSGVQSVAGGGGVINWVNNNRLLSAAILAAVILLITAD